MFKVDLTINAVKEIIKILSPIVVGGMLSGFIVLVVADVVYLEPKYATKYEIGSRRVRTDAIKIDSGKKPNPPHLNDDILFCSGGYGKVVDIDDIKSCDKVITWINKVFIGR